MQILTRYRAVWSTVVYEPGSKLTTSTYGMMVIKKNPRVVGYCIAGNVGEVFNLAIW